jgi:hypothetical protein
MKGFIMSKSSKAVTITVSKEQFTDALTNVVIAGNDALAALTTVAAYIAQCTNKKDQDAAKKQLAQAWIKYQLAVEGKTIKLESAQVWVARRVKALAPKGFKWLVSKTAGAAKMRAARQAKAPAAAPAAPAKPKVTPIEQYRNAIIAKENEICDQFRNLIPEGKRKEFEQAFAAFIATLNVVLK